MNAIHNSKKNLLCLSSDVDDETLKVYQSYPYPSYEYLLDEEGKKTVDANKMYQISIKENMIYRSQIISRANADKSYRDLVLSICKHNILFYVNTFCFTYRLDLPIGQDPYVNVCTFPFQDDILTWMVWNFKNMEDGIVEKSRAVGATWIWVWFMDWLAKFHKGITTGTMSQKEDDVDNRTANSILEKLRINLRSQPKWMRFGWEENSRNDRINMIEYPETGSVHLGGVAKGTAFRGGRLSVSFNDEFAHVLEASQVLDSLSAISGCNMFVSTPKGENNEFARMALTPGVNKKSIHWSLHPLRNKEWEKKIRSKPSVTEETFAQEYEISYTRSNVGRIFPNFIGRASDDESEWCHVSDPETDTYDFKENYEVYTLSDLGKDTTYFGFFQFLPVQENRRYQTDYTMVLFDEYCVTGSDANPYKVRRDINQKADNEGYTFAKHITDWRTGPKDDGIGKSWHKRMSESRQSLMERYNADYGEPIFLEGERFWPVDCIETVSIVLNTPGKFIIHPRCHVMIMALNNWTYEVDRYQKDVYGRPLLKTNNKGNPIPDHSPSSHPGTALLWGMQYFFGKKKLKKENRKYKDVNWDFRVRNIRGV